MNELLDRVGPVRLWAVTVLAVTIAVAAAAVAFPQRVYVEVIWQYYWGPVVADANGWSCVAWAGGEQVDAGANCADAGPGDGPTATPGYTWQSYAGYVPTLLLLLVGIYFVVEWLEIDRFREGFYGLFPFMLFGGALRTVEDANVQADLLIPLPWSALLISPFIYVVVALVAVVAVVIAVWLERRGTVSNYAYPLAAIGTGALVLTVAILAVLSARGGIGFFPLITVATIGGATLITAVTWVAIDRLAPGINRGTGYMGLVVIWAHAVDGIANLIGLDYATAFGWPYTLSPKHPINAAIVDFFGTAWPFVALKVAAAVFIIWVFDEAIFEESPRYAILLLITVVAVGLGPGTRDMLRATFGV